MGSGDSRHSAMLLLESNRAVRGKVCVEAVVGPGRRDMKVGLRLEAMGFPLVSRVRLPKRLGQQEWLIVGPGLSCP